MFNRQNNTFLLVHVTSCPWCVGRALNYWCYWNLTEATFKILSREQLVRPAVEVFYRGHIKLTGVDADDLGMIYLFWGSMWLGCQWWCWHLDYTRFDYIPSTTFPFERKLQCPRLDRSSSNTSVYFFMTSSMRGWPQLSERCCMGDEVCIWRNAGVLTKRCHFLCSIIILPIPSAGGTTAYQQLMWKSFVTSTGSAKASMSLTSVSQIIAVMFHKVCILYRTAVAMTDIPVWDTLEILFFSHECSGSTSVE